MSYFIFLFLYFVVLHAAALLNLMGQVPGGRVFYLVDGATIIPFFLAVLYIMRGLQSLKTGVRFTKLDFAVLGYIGISLLSVVLYYQPNSPTPIEAFSYGVHLFILPMFTYFAVKTLGPQLQHRLILGVCLLNLFAMVVGLYLFYERPDFYHAFLLASFQEKNITEDWQVYSRMGSYMGSTAVGTVCASTIILLSLNRSGLALMTFALPLLLVSVLLSKQRGGIAACFMALIYLICTNRRYFWLKLLALLISVPALSYGLNLFDEKYEGTVDHVYERSTYDMVTVFLHRGYGPGLEYFVDFPFGVGLGGTSSAAQSAGLAERGQVVDANFMRILADLGIIGLSSFLLVLWFAVQAAGRKEKQLGWVVLVGVHVLICLGTNTLDSSYVSHCFWLFLGIIDTPELRRSGFIPSTARDKPRMKLFEEVVGPS
jgi:hypothetical protein